YNIRYNHGIVPRFTPRPMHRGTLIAKCMHFLRLTSDTSQAQEQVLALQNKTLESAEVKPFVTEEIAAYARQEALEAWQIAKRAWRALNPSEWRTLKLPDGTPCIELEMRLQLDDDTVLQGTLDWIALHEPTGHVWLVDDKTRGNIQTEDFDDFQLQAPVY